MLYPEWNHEVELNTVTAQGLVDVDRVSREVESDEELQNIINILKENPKG